MNYWGPPKAEAARKGTRSRNGIGWHLDFAVAEIVDVKCVLTSFECSKGKKTGRKTQRSSNILCGADSDAVNLCQFLGWAVADLCMPNQPCMP